jgi:hypothetical protein
MKLAFVILFATLLLVGIAPVLGMLAASLIASSAGCTLNEGGTYPCLIMGADWGETLNFLFVAAWFFLLTFPLALLGALGLGTMGIIALVRKLRG